MQVIDYLNTLAQQGLLTPLCQAGLINIKRHTQREIYLHYQALAACPRYVDRPTLTATQTAQDLGIHFTTVYEARKAMQQPLLLARGCIRQSGLMILVVCLWINGSFVKYKAPISLCQALPVSRLTAR